MLERLVRVVRRNLGELMQAAVEGRINGPTTVLDLEVASGVGKSTIYRILDPDVRNDTSMGNLEALAACYGFQGWQLLRPDIKPEEPDEVDIAVAVYQQIKRYAGRGRSDPHNPGKGGASSGDTGTGANSGAKPQKRPKHPR